MSGRNANKNKGDKSERAAVEMLVGLAPDLVSVQKPGRKLGAGRKDDEGDLWVFHDVAIQNRCLRAADLARAVRTSAVDAATQAANGHLPFSLGTVPIHNARATSVRWLACCLEWPDPTVQHDEVARFGLTEAAVAHVRNDRLGVPRTRRIAAIVRKADPTIIVAPIEAWLAAYRLTREPLAVSA